MKDFKKYIDGIVRGALKEDIGRVDITTEALFPKDRRVKAFLLAKEDMVFAGKQVFESVFRALGDMTVFTWEKREGERIKKGSRICIIEGSLKDILRCERVALNFVQRLSGIATMTAKFVKKLGSKRISILDTRKTTPLLRRLEKYSVKIGGGNNHRMGLFDSFLIKDNHIAAIGSIKKAVVLAKKYGRSSVEIETKNMKEVKEAVLAGADIIMLDNMDIRLVKRAIKMIGEKAKVEVSGGINLKNIGRYRDLDIDYISIGALTHSAPSVDMSLELKG